MQVFTKVVETCSFCRAAEVLDLPRASVSTTVKALKSYLKVRLINRTTRSLSLTLDGAAHYERCVRILTDVEDSENSLSGTSETPKGKLRVDMPGSIGRLFVVPALPEFQARYPGIQLKLGLGDRDVDVVREGIDCVVRVGELPDSSIVARRPGGTGDGYCRQPGLPAKK